MAVTSISFGIFLSCLQCYLVLAQEKPCGSHNVKVDHFRNCAEPPIKSQIIKIHNVTFSLTDDCKLIPRGCFKVKKPISAAKVEYTVTKAPFRKKGTEDFCKQLENPKMQKGIEPYKTLPRKCTIPAGDYCINKGSNTVDELNSKILALITGTSTGQFIVTPEGSDETACVEFKVTVTRKG